MKRFTLDDIKEFCKAHYEDYMGETETAIAFSFLDRGFRRTITFLEMVEGMESGLSGTFEYLGCGDFGENKYMFNFKRAA